jgi:CRISPR-associated protein Cas2
VPDARTTTLYVIAYDISDDRRRAKVHKALSGYGRWTQYSLFECFLNERQYLQLRHRLEQYLDAGSDSVRFYPLCQSCQRKVETVGGAPPSDPLLILV